MSRIKWIIISLAIMIVILLIVIANMPESQKVDLPKQIEIEVPEELVEIKSNDYNNYKYSNIPDDREVIYLFRDYIDQTIYEVEEAYNCLEEEYKKTRFKDLNDFKEYIDLKKEQLKSASIYEYNMKEYDEYKQYVVKDQFDNYYIFKETAVLNYTVMLDMYTIDIPQYTEKYDSCNPQEKVVLSIEKIKQALNSGDYTYAYNKLAPSFKNNKYKTEQEFENYMKATLYNNIEIEYKNFRNEGETYIYDVAIKNMINKSDQEIGMQIIMQLKEERDFVMSFSMK